MEFMLCSAITQMFPISEDIAKQAAVPTSPSFLIWSRIYTPEINLSMGIHRCTRHEIL